MDLLDLIIRGIKMVVVGTIVIFALIAGNCTNMGQREGGTERADRPIKENNGR